MASARRLVMLVPRTDHRGERPSWYCAVCSEPWPCPVAKVELAEQYQQFPRGLVLYLGSCLLEAIDDWIAGDGGSSLDLYERFMSWAEVSDPKPSGRKVTSGPPSPARQA
jgi:hypothetical protein